MMIGKEEIELFFLEKVEGRWYKVNIKKLVVFYMFFFCWLWCGNVVVYIEMLFVIVV